MTNPTLERAARALWFERGGSWSDASDWQKQQCVYEARAVLMAVRNEGINIYHGSDPKSHFPEYSAAEGFSDMIQAILNDGEGE